MNEVQEITKENEDAVRKWLDFQGETNTTVIMAFDLKPGPELYNKAMRYFKRTPIIPD